MKGQGFVVRLGLGIYHNNGWNFFLVLERENPGLYCASCRVTEGKSLYSSSCLIRNMFFLYKESQEVMNRVKTACREHKSWGGT